MVRWYCRRPRKGRATRPFAVCRGANCAPADEEKCLRIGPAVICAGAQPCEGDRRALH